MNDFGRLTREEQNERIIADQVRESIDLKKRIAELEAENATLRSALQGIMDAHGPGTLASEEIYEQANSGAEWATLFIGAKR